MKAILSIALAAVFLTALAAAPAEPQSRPVEKGDFTFRDRDIGTATFRKEGIDKEAVGGNFWLVSATGYRSPAVGSMPQNIQVSFFTPDACKTAIRVAELRRKKSYRMVLPGRNWTTGWNTFTWPTGDVLTPIGIHVSDLGFLVSVEPGNASGQIYPALVLDKDRPDGIEEYSFALRSDFSIPLLLWELFRLQDGKMSSVRSGKFTRVVAGQTLTMTIPCTKESTLPRGDYSLIFAGEHLEDGESVPLQKSFTFRHEPALK